MTSLLFKNHNDKLKNMLPVLLYITIVKMLIGKEKIFL